jgi:hypothetical protein
MESGGSDGEGGGWMGQGGRRMDCWSRAGEEMEDRKERTDKNDARVLGEGVSGAAGPRPCNRPSVRAADNKSLPIIKPILH